MPSVRDARMSALINELLADIQGVLQEHLVGLYLYGSLVSGGFDEAISDIDLLAATAREVDDDALATLLAMHDRFARDNPAWDNRIEVAYLSVDGLRSYKERTSRMAIISHGEPLHVIDAGIDWLANWYLVRVSGMTLFGPPPDAIIAPASKAEYVEAIREYARELIRRGAQMQERGWQSYTILSLCRARYTYLTGEHISKLAAAAWAQGAFPE